MDTSRLAGNPFNARRSAHVHTPTPHGWIATTDFELHEMARKIGVHRKWHQKPGTVHSHYDICLSKRALAIKNGAIEIDRRGVSAILKAKREALQSSNIATR